MDKKDKKDRKDERGGKTEKVLLCEMNLHFCFV